MHMVNSFLKNECKTKFEVLIRPNQLLRQHNWAVFSALVLLYELSFPAGETPEKGTEYNKFFRVSVDTLQTKKSLVNLMDGEQNRLIKVFATLYCPGGAQLAQDIELVVGCVLAGY
jgi:hypothetical protein